MMELLRLHERSRKLCVVLVRQRTDGPPIKEARSNGHDQPHHNKLQSLSASKHLIRCRLADAVAAVIREARKKKRKKIFAHVFFFVFFPLFRSFVQLFFFFRFLNFVLSSLSKVDRCLTLLMLRLTTAAAPVANSDRANRRFLTMSLFLLQKREAAASAVK